MTLTTAELEVLRHTVRDFLGKFRPVQGARDTSADARARVWAGMTDQLGLSGVGIAEEHGGVGEEREARRIVLEELGRALVPGPAFATLAVARVIAASGDAVTASQRLPEIAAGTLTAGFSVSEGISVRPDGTDRRRLFGEVRNVVDGAEATALPELDARRTVALIAQDLAFEQLGGARWCLETTRDFAKTRSQFGRTIGSFQAVKHMLADVAVENEAAWAAAVGMQDEIDGTAGQDVLAGSVVHTLASEAYLRAAGTAVQVHGAIAITDETDVHLHFKRATTGRQMLGGMSHHYQTVLDAALMSV